MGNANYQQQGIWISTGDPETVDDVTPYAPGMLGKRVTIKQPGPSGTPGLEENRNKTYRYVRTDSGMGTAPFKGAVAWWQDTANYVVTTDPTALGRGRTAGVFQNAITVGNYGFIQTRGPATVKFVDGVASDPTVAGLATIPSATAGKADTLAAGTAPTYPTLGWTSGVYDAAQAEAIVDLDVPETVD